MTLIAQPTKAPSRRLQQHSSRTFEASRLDLSHADLVPALALLACLTARLYEAWTYFLNPDEALHFFLASQPSVELAYKAALTNAHPPLLILLLHYWRGLGTSELILRMPSVLAGTASCWIIYQWLKMVKDRSTAFTAMLLFAFAPSLIGLSAEIRQYALLLFFISGCLYLAERAVRDNSIPAMILFSLSLCGALLTHYSSFIFAVTFGLYMLVRLYPYGKHLRLVAVWAAGQIAALTLAAYYLITHVRRLKQSGMAQGIAETWLRKSIFHPGENHVAPFVMGQTLRVFTYLLSHGVAGTLTLLAFLIGIILLLREKKQPEQSRPTSRELALLLTLPFLINCGMALAGLYPYGATRHSAFLAPFALSGAAIGFSLWKPDQRWIRPLVIFVCLALCNFFPAPPPLIRARNQRRSLMEEAVNSLRGSAPAGSVVFADYESGLLLGYYACGHGIVQIFPPLKSFARNHCGPYTVITSRPQEWKFRAEDLQEQLADMARVYQLTPGTKVWLFDAGIITDTLPDLQKQVAQLGCSAPQSFGENIFLCEIALSGNAAPKESRN